MPVWRISIHSAHRPPRQNSRGAGAVGLTAQQDAMLLRWGYPYVFETWFFHMTLTRRLIAPEKAIYQPAAEQYFARAIAMPRQVSDICLFLQSAPGEPFIIAERLKLRG